MTDRPVHSDRMIDTARLPSRAALRFSHTPDAAAIADIVELLELRSLRKVRLEGWLSPADREDWALDATLGATAVQSCVVTLEPVTTRIDARVARRYLAEAPISEDGETEMPEDDTVEALPELIDLQKVFSEALALALPDYPRAEGAELGAKDFPPPGVAPLTDDAVHPFAALKALKGTSDGDDEA
ncbi:MAG: DUF177 domain-containing protein [Paracoccaceae bacterium]|nr:DUF177 domain-containing protein [Paracoccaceae bacterium]